MADFFLYLIKVSAIQMVAFLGYRLLLEHDPLLNFRRWYLVGTLLLSFWIPVLVVWQVVVPELPPEALGDLSGHLPTGNNFASPAGTWTGTLLASIYLGGLLVSGWLMYQKLGWVRQQLREATTVTHTDGVRWVGLPYRTTPHTFGRWIFHEAEKPLAAGVREHELAHARHWHTFDRLLIGLVRSVCWFNPLLHYYEQAISLNHELLADRMAIRRSGLSISGYQALLLNHLSRGSRAPVYGSGMGFSLIKKRFQMLRISPSRPSHLFGKLAVIGLLWIGLIAGFGDSTYAQTAPPPPPAPAPPPPPVSAPTAPEAAPPPPPMPPTSMRVPIPPPPPPADPNMTVREWQIWLTEEQRKTNPNVPPPPPIMAEEADMKLGEWQLMKKKHSLENMLKSPPPFLTQDEYEKYINDKEWAVWLNGLRIPKKQLAQYDIGQLRRRSEAPLHIKSRAKKGYSYAAGVITEAEYLRIIKQLRQEIAALEQ